MRVVILLLRCATLPLVLWVACSSVATGDARLPLRARVIGIDHVPLAVRDLDAASERYRRLGFVLKEGRPHANGIRNRHAKFPDGTEIELITADKATDALTTRYVKHLSEGDGPAFLALFVTPYGDLHAMLREEGFRASESNGLITLSGDSRLPYVFFGNRQRSPTDRPEHFRHRNSARSLTGVWLAADDLSAERKLLQLLGARLRTSLLRVPEPTSATVAQLPQGSVVLLPGTRQLVANRRIVGLTVVVENLKATARAVGSLGRMVMPDDTTRCQRIVVSPHEAHGVWLEFRGRCE